MKAIAIILCLGLVSGAVYAKEVNNEVLVENVVNEVAGIVVSTAEALEHQFEEIVLDPLHEIESAVESIEQRTEEDEHCVREQDDFVQETITAMHGEMGSCGATAAKTSAQIMVDVNNAAQQLIFDGVDVLTTYRKCKKYKNPILKNTCYANLTIKGTLYLRNARRSIKTIKGANQRVPEVFTDADVCTHSASEKALLELEGVHSNIDSCVATKRQ